MVATMQDYVDAPSKQPAWFVFINGVLTECIDANVRYGVREPIGSCILTMGMPLPDQVAMDATVEVQAGYGDHVQTIFTGTIPQRRRSIDMSGSLATLTAVSESNALTGQDYADVEYAGPISLKDLFQAMCRRRGVASFFSDATTYPNGVTEIRLGNNEEANERAVTVPRKMASHHFINDIANLFGYYVFDTPMGMRQRRVSGMPVAASALDITEAWNAIDLVREEDTSTIVNYWEVFGARYTDADGVEQQLRSIPEFVPEDYERDERESELLDTIQLADAVRNVLEIDHSEMYSEVQWTTHGAPHLMPGDTVNVTSPLLEATGLQWLMSVEHTFGESGFTTTCTGWRGAGSPLPAGEDCIVTNIPGGVIRLGDEYVPWYAIPQAGGKQHVIPFTVLANYSSIAVYGHAHGTNSQFIGNENADLEISKFEIWQNGERAGSGNLPVLNEDYARQLPYGSGLRHWSPFVIPISGSLEPGPAELRIIAGENSNLPSSTRLDDFELQGLSLRTCGVGEPRIGVPK